MICNAFCGERLANSWLSVKDKNQTLALPFDHVVEMIVHCSVVFDQRLDKQLPVLRQQQSIKGVRVELHFTDHLNREKAPSLIGKGESWDFIIA